MIKRSVAESFDLIIQQPDNIKIKTVYNEVGEVTGRVTINIKIGNEQKKTQFYIIDKCSHDIIIGITAIIDFRLFQYVDLQIYQLQSSSPVTTINISAAQRSTIGTADCRQIGSIQSNKEPTQEPILVGTEPNASSSAQDIRFIENITDPTLHHMIAQYSEMFSKTRSDLGCINNAECVIETTSNVPINIKPYRTSLAHQEIIKQQVDRLLAAGLISQSYSPYSFPVVLVDKKDDGEKSRLCIDYRKLNQITVTEGYPFPLIEDIVDKVRDCGWFTTLDIASGYHHIRIPQSHRQKTAFCTHEGKFEWNVMPFGLKNAPSIFQRAIHSILQQHKLTDYAINYIDDIIIFSKTLPEHYNHVKTVLEALKIHGIKLKPSKCHFSANEVNYLGHTITKNSVKPISSNLESINKLPSPRNTTELRRALGKLNYYRRFIENCSSRLAPLNCLLKKDTDFTWNNQQETLFREMIQTLCVPPVLTIFDRDLTSHVFTDASKLGIGAVLKQPTDEILRPVSYFSKSLTSYQKNYTITELECLAIVEALRYWHHYLHGRKFVIHTDHSSLKWIHNHKSPNTRLMRWSIELSQYDFDIVHVPGDRNTEADDLSRNPVITEVNAIEPTIDNENQTPRTNVPADKRTYIKQKHRELAHLGAKKMYHHLKKEYNWPTMRQDIHTEVERCISCKCNKSRPPNRMGTFHPTKVTRPFELISLDTIGGLSNYGSKKKYLHVAIDHFSRYVWYVTSTGQTAPDFIHLVQKIRNCGGDITAIRTDNYPALTSSQFKTFLRRHDIDLQHSAPNSPQSMGIVERVNQTLINQLRASFNDPDGRRKSWVRLIKSVIEVYNETRHSSTECEPKILLLGDATEEQKMKAVECSSRIQDYNANRLNKNSTDCELKPGDKVFVLNEARPNRLKLDPIYVGPGIIKGKSTYNLYLVNLGGRTTIQHSQNLVRCPEEEEIEVGVDTTSLSVLFNE